ncbi:MAG: anti-sigma factor family protein, partial [Myxococcales bacterium]
MNREARTCANVDALLLDYAYGELEAADRLGVEGHLAECAKCRAELEAM